MSSAEVVAGGAGAWSVMSADVRAGAATANAGFAVSAELRAVAGGADAGFASEIDSARDGESADRLASSDVAGVATGLLCAGSASESERSARGEDFSRAFVDVV